MSDALPCPFCGNSKINTYTSASGIDAYISYRRKAYCSQCDIEVDEDDWNRRPLDATARREGAADMRERAAQAVEAQPYYPDTNIGMRQQWVKDQAAARIRSLPTEPDGVAPAPGDGGTGR